MIPRHHELLIAGESRGTILVARGRGHALGRFADCLLPCGRNDDYAFELKDGKLLLAYGITTSRPFLLGPLLRRRGVRPSVAFSESFTNGRGITVCVPSSRRIGYYAEYDIPHTFSGEVVVSFRRDVGALGANGGRSRAEALEAYYVDKRILRFTGGALLSNQALAEEE